MKIPYNLLIHHKEPFLYLDYCKVRMKDGILTSISEKGRVEIPVAKYLLIILGAGTSISQEAIIFCGQNNCHLAIGRGGCYIHSYWMSGRWTDPRPIAFQAGIHSDINKRLEFSKEMLKYRFIRESANSLFLDKLDLVQTQEQLLSLEALWAKDLYKIYRTIFDVDFKRSPKDRQGINSKITLLNNALYSITTAIILNMGLHPSVGLIHGQTRRGGFSFDLADIFKSELTLDLSFKYKDKDFKFIMTQLNLKLKEDNYKIIKEMIRVCYWMSGEEKSIC